jgi:hypothetical protein
MALGWVVLLAGWMVTALAAPLHDDNRPRTAVHEFDVDREISSS